MVRIVQDHLTGGNVVLAFNKDAAEELKDRGLVNAKTFHSFTYHLLKALLNKELNVSGSKTSSLPESWQGLLLWNWSALNFSRLLKRSPFSRSRRRLRPLTCGRRR